MSFQLYSTQFMLLFAILFYTFIFFGLLNF